MSKNTCNTKNLKGRHFSFIVYPESAPKHWIDIINESGVTWACSPLHDKDVITEYDILKHDDLYSKNDLNMTKKEHYHCLIAYPNTTTENHIQATYLDPINNHNSLRVVGNILGAYQYFTHENEIDDDGNYLKYHYNKKDIKCFNGFNIADLYSISNKELLILKKNLTNHCIDHKIKAYNELVQWSLKNELDDEFYVISQHALYFKSFIESFRDSNFIRYEEKHM